MSLLSLSIPSRQQYLIRRSTTDKLLDEDETFEAEVDGPSPPPKKATKKETSTRNNGMVSLARSRASQRALNLNFNAKITEQPKFGANDSRSLSVSYGSTKCREILRQFQRAEKQYIIFLRTIISNIIHPLRMMFVKLSVSDEDMIQFNIIFDITLRLYRFHDASLHQLTAYQKKSGSRRAAKTPLFRFYEQFPTFYATYFDAAFKAVSHLSPIITSHAKIKKWLRDKCCTIILLYDTTNSSQYQSFAEILRDISVHCVEQSKKLQQIAVSKHFIMNKESRAFRQNMYNSLEKSYIKRWNTEYKHKFDLMHLEMTLMTSTIGTLSEAKMAEDHVVTELDKLNATMLSFQNDMKLLQKRVIQKQPQIAAMSSIEEHTSIDAFHPPSLSLQKTPPPDSKRRAPNTAAAALGLKPSKNQQTFASPPKKANAAAPRMSFKRRAPVTGGLGLPSFGSPQAALKKSNNVSLKPRLLISAPTGMKEKAPDFKRREPVSGPLKISIEKFGYKSNVRKPPKREDDPTPVTDKEMFKYFKKIDMGKHRMATAELYQDPLMFDMSYSPSASPDADGGFTFVGAGADDEDDMQNMHYMESDGDLSTDEEEKEQDSDEEDSDDNDDSDSDDDDDPFSFMAFLTESANVEAQTVYAKHGYKKLHKLCDTIQGELVKAFELETDKHVVIKKAEKEMVEEGIAVLDEMAEVVAENRIKEAQVLKYLTESKMPMTQYIAHYKDSFESDEDHFLVVEYVESQINLKQFVQIAQKYIKKYMLKLEEYRQCIKRLFWQLSITVFWLHDVMNCCHLDLCLENIMLKDCSFVTLANGTLAISPKTSIKLCDFGVAEIFEDDDFSCEKTDLSIDNQSYLAPKVIEEDIYDARAADMWCLGMILFHLMTGQKLYEPMEKAQSSQKSAKNLVSSDASSLSSLVSSRKSRSSMTSLSGFMCNGYRAVYDGSLKEFLTLNDQVAQFDHHSFDLMIGLLNVKEKARFDAMHVLKHEWFASYYKTHKELIQSQMELKSNAMQEMNDFPFYKMY